MDPHDCRGREDEGELEEEEGEGSDVARLLLFLRLALARLILSLVMLLDHDKATIIIKLHCTDSMQRTKQAFSKQPPEDALELALVPPELLAHVDRLTLPELPLPLLARLDLLALAARGARRRRPSRSRSTCSALAALAACALRTRGGLLLDLLADSGPLDGREVGLLLGLGVREVEAEERGLGRALEG